MTDVRLTATNPLDSSVVPVACNEKGELLLEDVEASSNFPDGLTVGPKDGTPVTTLAANGSAKFADYGHFGNYLAVLNENEGQVTLNGDGYIITYRGTTTATDSLLKLRSDIGGAAVTKAEVFADGSAEFQGDVVISSRNKSWMIVESNGLAHLVEQTRAGTADLPDAVTAAAGPYPPLRDIPGELTMVEQHLQKVMERLKMAPEAGWEVWDGSD